jgi:hypothetical protein
VNEKVLVVPQWAVDSCSDDAVRPAIAVDPHRLALQVALACSMLGYAQGQTERVMSKKALMDL